MPNRSRTVVYPDHPLLVRGPDVLVRVDNDLHAYFTYAGEGQRPGSPHGRARTLLSRLALPQEATFILVTADQTSLHDDDVELFDAIQTGISPRKRQRDQWYTLDERTAVLVGQLRGFHLRRFANAWTANDAVVNTRRPKSPPTSRLLHQPSRRLNQPSRRLPDGFDLDREGGQLYAPAPTVPDRTTLTRWATQLVTTAVDLDYAPSIDSLEATVGALRSHRAHLPLHFAESRVPIAGRSQDVFKPYRAAAFAGFHTTIPEQ
jgi:hypothetical protein